MRGWKIKMSNDVEQLELDRSIERVKFALKKNGIELDDINIYGHVDEHNMDVLEFVEL